MKWSIISFVLLVLASCQHREESLDPTLEGFFAEGTGQVRGPARFAEVQAASGARADATLSRQHFDGGRLNSLGEEKLARMLKDDDAAEPMRVYLNVDERDGVAGARRAAVVAYLKDSGLAESQIDVVFGRNPGTWSRASTHLSNLPKTESGATGNGGAAPAENGGNELGKGGGSGGGLGGGSPGEASLFK